ncbi:DUF3854 domain-containing protein [Actinomyces vulturis]|uniref:DUF3854 domain-containing protein n=1 Tax=Actinomyces vulturis TaxID=1857645 RepID=UPI000AF12411|nr:DUF3854 domain-containing protein [Actinomyces vulturis]
MRRFHKKLDSSGIHPAIASSRNYVVSEDKNDIQESIEATTYAPPSRSWYGYRQLSKCTAGGPVLLMPWYCPGDNKPTLLQFRPDEPLTNKDGSQSKYVIVKNSPTILDVHPCVPEEWLSDENVRLLIVEGLLKADSFLSAMVAGLDENATPEQITEHLRSLPPQERTVPVAIFGVTTWRNCAQWASLPRRNRNVYLAFDADVETNHNVYNQARQFFDFLESSRATPWLVRLSSVGAKDKDGIDDYLASGGLPGDIIASATVELPDPPAAAAEVGKPYVSENGCAVEVVKIDPLTGSGTVKRLIDVGGHIDAIELQRAPSQAEIVNGLIDETDSGRSTSDDRMVRLHVGWIDPDLGETSGYIIGPERMLQVSPDRWDRLHVEVPFGVAATPGWPPTREWLDAVKRETQLNWPKPTAEVRCTVNGWVPGTSGLPVFVLGKSVIGSNSTVALSPSRLNVPMIDRFGLEDPGENWQEKAREVLPEVVYTMLSKGAWTNKGVAMMTMSAGLRPALPLRPKTTLFYVGSRGAGKSWSGSKISGFWARYPDAFNPRSAGGSANDTYASLEHAVGWMPVWVADDLAPDTSRSAAENRESSISSIVRAIANGQGRSRMRPDGSVRETILPRALLVVTAENSLGVSSARDRVVPVVIEPGSLGSQQGVDCVNDLFSLTTLPSDLSACMIRYILSIAQERSWEGAVDFIRKCFEGIDRRTVEFLEAQGLDKGAATRFREMAADLLSPIIVLRNMAKTVGLADDDRISDLFDEDVLGKALGIVVDAVRERAHFAPGEQMLEALRSLLSSGKAHVIPENSAAPFSGNESKFNTDLGWSFDQSRGWTPSGVRIGWYDKENDCVIFSMTSAFTEASKHFSHLVPPGTKCREVFKAMEAEGLVHYKGKQKGGPNYMFKLSNQQVRGVPVPLKIITAGE